MQIQNYKIHVDRDGCTLFSVFRRSRFRGLYGQMMSLYYSVRVCITEDELLLWSMSFVLQCAVFYPVCNTEYESVLQKMSVFEIVRVCATDTNLLYDRVRVCTKKYEFALRSKIMYYGI